MINSILALSKKHHRPQDQKESGAAMIFAIILLIMLVSVTIFVASAATVQSNSTRSETVRTALLTASNNGIEWALATINGSTEFQGVSPAIDGMTKDKTYTKSGTEKINGVENVTWKVWTERVTSTNNVLSYYIYSKAYSTKLGEANGLTQRVIVEGTPVTSSTVVKEAGKTPYMSYQYDTVGAWSQGIFTTTKMTVSGSGKVYSYNSLQQGPYPSGSTRTTVSTNGQVGISGTSTGISRIIGGQNNGVSACIPAASTTDPAVCDLAGAPEVAYRGVDLGLKTLDYQSRSCTNPGYSITDWTASAKGGNLPTVAGGVYCVFNLNLDADTRVPASYSANNPLTIVVLGDVTISNGAAVNWGNSPRALQVIGTGGGVFDLQKGSEPKVSLFYAGENSDCKIGSGSLTGTVTFFGALACKTIYLTSGNKLYVDSASYALANETPAGFKVWSKNFQEIYEDNT